MKRAAFAIILLLCISLESMAHTIDLGFVNKQGGTTTGEKPHGKTAASAAIRLPKEMLVRYASADAGGKGGNEFRSVRVNLPKLKNLVDSVVVWVRTSLDGENLATGTASRFKDDGLPTLEQGWNTVNLTSPVTIEKGKEDYVGYTYYQRTKVCATNYYYRGTSGYSYLQINGDWKEWQEGALCIEAGIDGASMPQKDFLLQGAKGIVEADGGMMIQTRLFNMGQAMTHQLMFSIANEKSTLTVNADALIPPNTLDTLSIPLLTAPKEWGVGTNVTVTLTAIDGEKDAFADDNTAQCVFNYSRMLLIEEFTTERCPNCPKMAELLNNFIHGGSELGKQSVMVCHHAGYYTDEFTTQDALDYQWFYNAGGGTYAPAVMFNRRPYNETEEGLTPVVFPTSEEQVMGYAEDCLAEPSTLILSTTADVNLADSFVTVNVKGRKLEGFGCTNPKIFVYLTEDNVLSTNGQAGSGTETYYHQHIVRGQNQTWGENIVWEGDDFTYATSFDFSAGWKVNDMKIIVSVGNYDANNPGNCVIENSTAVKLANVIDAVDAVCRTSNPVAYTYYSLSGAQLARPAHGVTIVKGSDGSLRKIVRK